MRHEQLSVGELTVDAIKLAPTATNVDLTGNVAGDLTVGDDLVVADDATIGGDLTMTGGNAAITGNVTASGTVQAEQLTSTDDASVADDLTVGGDVAVTGNYTSAAGNVTLTSGTVSAEQLTSTDDLTVADDASIGGDLTVTGTIVNTALSGVILPLIVTPTITVGEAAADAITVAAQFKTGGSNLTYPISGLCYLSDSADGIGVTATGPDSVADGGDGAIQALVANKVYLYQTNATGSVQITITETTEATSFYLVFILPNNKLAISGIITPYTA